MKMDSKSSQVPQRFSATFDALLTNLSNTGRGRKQALSIAVDSILVVVSLWAAYTLRHGDYFTDFKTTWHIFILMPVITAALFSGLGIYRWIIRSTNNRMFRQLIKGCFVSALALVMMIYLFPPERSNPRSLFVIYAALLLIGSSGVRILWQGLYQDSVKGEPIAIFGAGAGGRQLMNLLAENGTYRPVVFIDDDAKFRGSTLFGLPVLVGDIADLKTSLKRYEVNRVVLAMPSIGGNDYQRVLSRMEQLDLPVQTLPGLDEIITGRARADEIRDISIHDILGRPEVHPDRQLIARKVEGRRVLVTGGGGSIGSELCRQIMHLSPIKLVVFDNSEENLYHITEELKNLRAEDKSRDFPEFRPVLGTVMNASHLRRLIREEKIDTVYHAAAYKHVPIVEAQPDQGARTNVFGTLRLLKAALENGVSDFVLVSTDKAVRPTNAMGATKRVAEMILQAQSELSHRMCISMVRFGNVLGSSGSVVPKFSHQIQSGGPVTLTHSKMTRYFMTISEAAQLVLQASAIAKGGDVFVLDMGEPVRIEELAVSMVRLYGKKLSRDTGNPDDIEIVEQGIRPGEKMYEEMFITDDHHQTEVSKIFKADEASLDWKTLSTRLDKLSRSIDDEDLSAVREQLLLLAFAGDTMDAANEASVDKTSSNTLGVKSVDPISLV